MFGSMHQLQSIQGPADPNLKHSEIEGYSPVSRIGEVVINSFVVRRNSKLNQSPAHACTPSQSGAIFVRRMATSLRSWMIR